MMSENRAGSAGLDDGGGGDNGDPGGGAVCGPIENGIQLQIKDRKRPLASFTYAWAPTTEVLKPLDWITVSKEDVQYNHIRCYELQEGDNLAEVVAKVNSNQCAQALILINTEDSYLIDPKFLTGKEQLKLPILVLTSESGKALITALSQYPQNTEAKVLKFPIQVQSTGPVVDSSLTKTSQPATNGSDTDRLIVRDIRDTQQLQQPFHQKPIENGLVLKIEGEGAPRYFTYAWSPTTERPQRISDWVAISDGAIEQFHIRCYQLTEKENDIQLLVAELDSKATAALILINNKDDYQIGSRFLPENEKWEFPILVVKPGSGRNLMEIIAKHGRNVTAKVEVSSLQKLHARETGPQSDKTFNIVRIEELIFPASSKPKIILSETSGLFQLAMREFQVFETTKHSKENEKKLFTLLMRKFQDTFPKDFLFCIAVAHRTCFVKPKQYRSKSPQEFEKSCIERFEKLDTTHVSTALNDFFKRGDFCFDISLTETPDPQRSHSREVSVFRFLEQAFNRLLKEQRIKEYQIYPTMLWITTYLSFCTKQPNQESGDRIWQEYFLKDAHRYSLDSGNIEGLKKALTLGQALNLPAEVTFSTSLLGELLVPADNEVARSFTDQKNSVIAVEEYLSSGEEFMEHVVVRLREAYKQSRQQSDLKTFLRKVSNGTLCNAIRDGLLLLDAMLKVIKSRPLQPDEDFQQWILLLLSLTEEGSAHLQAQCLQEVLSQQYNVTNKYSNYIMEQTRTCLMGLQVEHFYRVYTTRDPSSWSPEILTEYLDKYNISAHINLSDPTWQCFFELVVAKFPGAANQRHIYKFLARVANCYQKQSEPSKLIVDLMKLSVPGLFSVQYSEDTSVVADFEDLLREFIHKNSVISQTKEIMDCITFKDGFQEVILAAVLKEIDLLQPSLSQAIAATVGTLTRDMRWLQSEPSPKQMFCLDFVNACCTRISIFSNRFASIESVDWVMFQEYYPLIIKVGTLYSFSKSDQNQTTLCNALPDVVARNPSTSRSYFEWIQKFHFMLEKWKSRLQAKEGGGCRVILHQSRCSVLANHEEINWYLKSHKDINSLAGAVAATDLVVPKTDVEALKKVFLETFKNLNQLVLKYIPKFGCCSVISILSEYGTEFPQELQSELSANVIFPDEKERAVTIECAELPSPVDENFKPPTNTWLSLARKCSLNSLCQLVRQITTFLAPVEPSMDLLVYFTLHHSYLFSTHMHRALSEIATNERTPEQVHIAVDHVKALLVKVLKGTATYGEIIVENFRLEVFKVEEEFSTLLECQNLRQYGTYTTGFTGIKSLLKLIQFARPILILKQVFEQYGLDRCSNDSHFEEIYKLALTLQDSEERANISIYDAIQKWKIVYKALCLKENASPKSLELFSKVADSADFYQFLKEKDLVGTLGSVAFHHKVEIITRHQERDDYQEMVLNHLIAAFEFIAPIMDPSHKSLHSLMSAVATLELPEGLPQLETVRKNMHFIQFWFSHSEDTPENVSSELNGILESGSYRIESEATVTRESRLQLVLEYELSFVSISPTDQSTPETQERAKQEVVKFQNRTLTTENIEDFAHRLELLKGEDEKVQFFLHLNEVAYRLLEVFGKLQELGHPILSQKSFIYTLDCSTSLPVIEEKVEYWEGEEEKWMGKVENLHNSNKWLLFFRVPKLIVLYEALTAESPSVPAIIQEIGFLFQRKAHTNESFKSAVTIAVENCRQGSQSDLSPMEIVGSFLDHWHLFDQVEVKKWSLPVRYNKKYASLSQANNVLYNATGYTESELVGLILGLYGGPPETFEFLHCKPTTTEQELRLLMKRAVQHPRLYLLAEVNNLPYQLQEVLLRLILQLKHRQTCIYFIETAPSLLREVSYLKFIDYKEEVFVDKNKTHTICKATGVCEDWPRIELVYGMPGTGKTHYIRDKMKTVPENHQVTIAINEAFTTLSAIERLRTLPRDARNCAIFFNFTIFPPMNGTDAREEEHYQLLMKTVRWFFFELLIFGYVEDPATGLSFQYPAGLSWALYNEVPSRATWKTPADLLEWFEEEVPALALLGTPVYIDPGDGYCIDEDVQLVCKYLRSYESGEINSVCGSEGEIKFSTDPSLSDTECKRLLQKYMSDHAKETKLTQKLFIQYMKRRCTFLDNLPAFNYNTGYGEYIVVDGKRQKTDTRHLGSTLMQTMLKEVKGFCDHSIKESWSQEAHQQLIYDFAGDGGSFGLICLLPDDPELKADKERFKSMGVEIPSLDDLYSRAVLDKYLSRALGVPLSKDGRLSPIDERQYVLTLDYTLKMLNIHERYECGVPVIIEGETGVGKTALIEMLSELWNHTWIAEWNRDKDRIVDLMHRKMGDLETGTVDESQNETCVVALSNLGGGKMVTEEMWNTIAQLPDSRFESGRFYSVLNRSLLKLEGDLKFAMLKLELNDGEKLADVFTAIKTKPCSETTAHLLYIIFSATVKTAFHKMNIHADLQPKEIEEFFEKVILQADELKQAYEAARRPQQLRVPSVTAYLDEINTASCLGLFKEIIVDRTINGKHIPENVFIIASCNPHRGDVLTVMHDKDHESWLKGTYYVRKLHPTLEYLKWDYGSLNQQQEKVYVNAKMKMLCQESISSEDDIVASLSDLIVESQQRMREYALEQLQLLNIPETVTDDWLEHCANSSVSQRDIQRVFIFYLWLMKTYDRFNPHKEIVKKNHHRRAVLVSLGIVYFMRLNSKYRSKYEHFLNTHDQLHSEVTFSKAYKDELRWYIDGVELPPNIAKTEALMENVFATIVCTMTRTPLIIVGDPGSSKTLSFNIVAANLKGKESKIETYRHTDIFQSLNPHFYQCSRRTTSKEVEKTFKKAINRQDSLTKSRLPIRCVVFMDEAGLPEEKLESLKVLHYYLDERKVSFVAISNDIFDASKTNRAVSLFRPKPTYPELQQLAKASIFPEERLASMNEEKLLNHFCKSYIGVVCHEKLKKLFGLRDFIHFVIYLRCNRKYSLNAQLIVKALERNFNGSESFEDIRKIFFEKIPACVSMEGVHFRSTLNILKDSQVDCTTSEGDDIHKSIQSEVRYKLIIDPSEDDSLVRLLFTYGVLRRKDTRLFICSDFTGDSRSRVNTIVQIMHSVAAGHTILMCQTDEIHESFYDLFNQRFSSIKDPKHGTRFYTNIAIGAHSKLCRVNPAFQCVVVIKKSEVEDTPPPFLNRFEKYYLTHQSLLETVLSRMPPNLRILLEAAHKKAAEFISCVKQPNLYGCTAETLDSLLLTLLPPTDHEYIPLHDQHLDMTENIISGNYSETMPDIQEEVDIQPKKKISENICMFFLKLLLKMLRENAGFHIPKLLEAEVEEDAIYIFEMVLQNSEFKRALAVITHENIAVVIDEALDVLHQPTTYQVNTDALMVIAVLVQWFVSYLCKKLMQLVPPEAIPVHCGGIPTMYIRNYLEFQEHFSLKELIDQQLLQLKGNNWDRSVCPTKLLCFTRSSPLIYQLPTEYPATVTTRTPTKHVETLVREHIFTQLDLLSICKVTSGHSQGKLEKMFANSNHQVLLLIANMQELTKKMVNHLRIMIEEAESRMENKSKLFVLLLHFPPLMFFNPCYPSLFLQGWSHHYLDAIACGILTTEGVKSVVDIKSCFYHCCFSGSLSEPADEEGRMLEALSELFPEAIPIIASQVAFICESNGNLFELNASQRTELLEWFFKNTGESNCSGDVEGRDSIAQILTAKFCKYWTPELMVEQIEHVSRSMYAQDSTLNITDSIQSIVRAAFFDFLVYMFNRISEDHIIDISEEDGSPVVCKDQLFLTLLREIRVPELAQLKSLSATIGLQQEHKKAKCVLKFPLFKYVWEILDKMIDESREDFNQQFNIEKPSASLHPTQKKPKQKQKVAVLYMEVVMARAQKDKLQGCLGVTIKAMDDEQGDTIWRQYFDDFVTYKLDLDSKPSPLIREIIDACISPLETKCTDTLSRMVSLHVCFHVHHLNLTKVSRILSQIYRVEREMATLSPSTVPAATISTLNLMEHEDITSASRMPPSLGSFIIKMLFDFIFSADAASENLQCWYRSYCDIMSVPAMVENILSSLTSLPEAKLSIMHTTYLVMECYSSPQRGYQVFTALHSKQSAQRIHLHEIVTTSLQTMKGASSVQLDEESYCLQSFMEGLFAFFFSKHRALFDEEDCRYFMEVANKQHSTSINMLKFYLARILREPERDQSSQTQAITKTGHSELPLNSKYREMVGLVLAAQSDLGSPGPYIPTFYQLTEKMDIHFCESSKNALMQQPLAHLYFLTVLEHLQTRKYRESQTNQSNYLVRLAGWITVLLQKDSTQNAEKILFFIEKQAVVQMLIYEVAAFFDYKAPRKCHSLFNTKLDKRVNPLFTDESTGGSRNSTCVSWHALMLAMHLQKQLNSPWELIQLLSDDTSTLVKGFTFMKPLQTLIQPLRQPKCEAHLFPFLNDDSDLACFYKKICQTVSQNYQNPTGNMDALTKMAKESYSSGHKMKFTTSYGNLLVIDEKNAFRMLLWLCVYNEFYVKKLQSRSVADTLSSEMRGVLEPEFIGLLESFLYPDYMVPLLQGAEMIDPTDPELCHAMANTVAIVLACEPHSNHLWYHMFAADALSGSYMTGFMYPDKISENRLYDCGVELSRDGMYGRPDYLPHATRGTLSLHSLYFILWSNFSAFYMALATRPDALEKIRGPIISPRQHVHHYCVRQLRNAWLHMGNKLSLSPKEQSFFIMQCMERLLEISITEPTLLQTGRFETSVELDNYERIWHKHIFEQSLENIHSKFAEHCHLHENKLFQNISCLETYYPHFLTMDGLTRAVLSSDSVSINPTQNKLYVLSIFALEHCRLQAAGSLLPDLLELYHWIHNELAYLVTYEDAQSDTIEDVIEKYGGLEIVQLYARVRDGYNSYVEGVGEADTSAGVKGKQGANKLSNSTKLIDFLSAKTDDEQWEGSDLLYLILSDIINSHNSFLQRVFDAVSSSEHSSLRKYFPEKLEENVYSTEVNEDVMIIPRQSPKDYEVEEPLQIVRSRYLQPTEQRSGACPFDLYRLQIDVIQAYLAGKPLILHNRIHFRFKIERPNTLALEGADLDLSVISQGIKKEFKLQLEEEYTSQLLHEFHSADYQSLAEVVRGLRVATEHLKRELIVNEAELESKKLQEFLLSVFKEPKTEVLEDIGIKTLSSSQLACLQALKLPHLYSTMELFVNWVKDGMYDFHQLPFVMKKHLEPEDKEVLDMLDTNYTGTLSERLQELQLLTDNLVKSESHLKETIANNMKKPIMEVLRKDKEVEKSESIPDTVLCQHYVALRVMLRRKTVVLQAKLNAKGHKQEDKGSPWVEQVEDLWTAKLKHLWDVAQPFDYSDHMFQFDPGAGEYGLYGYQIEFEGTKEQGKAVQPPIVTDGKKHEPEAPAYQPPGTPDVREDQLKEVAKQLSIADIADFLKTDSKLKQYTELFEEEEIDGAMLFSCTKESLKGLGVANDFHCTKIIVKFEKYLRAKSVQ